MPVTMEMRENNRVTYWAFADPWSVGELVHVSKQMKPIFDNSTRKIHTMTVVMTRKIPAGVLRIREVSTWAHPMSGQLVVVNAPPVGISIVEVITRLARFDRVHFFNTEEQGWLFLREVLAEEDRQMDKQTM